jgi:hypothetical protein
MLLLSILSCKHVFCQWVERQLDRKVKVVKSDKRGELFGKHDEGGQCPEPFAKLLHSHGICAFIVPKTPRQNKVAVRHKRTHGNG